MTNGEVGKQRAPADDGASGAVPPFRPGQFVWVRSTGERAVVMSHALKAGAVTYTVGFVDDRIEGGILAEDLEAVE